MIKAKSNEMGTQELLQIRDGTKEFLQEMRPRGLMNPHAKSLLMKEGDNVSPSDHYFNYLSQRDREEEKNRELEIMK